MNELKLVPQVKSIEISNVPSTVLKFDLKTITIPYAKKLTLEGKITCILDKKLPSESYKLSIKPTNIVINHSDNAGILYALATLRQIFDLCDQLYALEIYDYPDFPTRGYMLDISRGKVPTLSTMKKIVDDLVMLKINHLELYIEGFSFAYPSFPKYWENKTPFTPDKIKELDAYCKERCIELVPTQNSLGHMGQWLKTEEYKHLSFDAMKQTANPQDPDTIDLVAKMCNDLLPNFTSDKFNVCLDEPFGLNKLAKKGTTSEELYLDYTLKMHEICKFFDKKMLMWGDIVIKHPELVDKLPKDVTVLEWGYEANHPFDEHCEKYKKANHDFIVCPGSSTWCSFTQKTEVSIANIRNAIAAAKKYGAKGVLLTDWGDMGHVQYLPFTYIPLSFAAMTSWNSENEDLENMLSFINKYFYLDEGDSLAQIVYTVGEYTKYEVEEDFDCRSKTFMTYTVASHHKALFAPLAELTGNILGATVTNYRSDKILRHMAMCYDALIDAVLTSKESQLVAREINNAITQISVGAMLRDYIEKEKDMPREKRLQYLDNIDILIEESKEEHGNLWTARNKESDCYGFYDTTAKNTIATIKKWRKQLKNNSLLYKLELNVLSPIAGFFVDLALTTIQKFVRNALGK